jgi:uroporphyrinogen-III synthase
MVKPPVIVTRAEPGASETMARLAGMSFTAIPSPMLELKALEAPMPDLSGIGNLVFTSANGVRFFVDAVGGLTDLVAHLTAWCVGPATTDAARAAGFQKIERGDGNSDDLAALILSSEGPKEGFVHVANTAAAGNLVAQLSAAGRDARFLALYETVPASRLNPEARQALRSGATSVVLVHSAKAANAFAALTAGWPMEATIFVTISEAAAAPLRSLNARAVIFAAKPNEDALMEALLQACKEL